MTIGGSLFLIAAGAILKYAVTANVSGFNLHVAGVVLMVVGILGLLLGLFLLFWNRPTEIDRPPPAI